jgi:aryl-alcohol dehydrogenase-like predicted oxidoreductase
MEKRKIGVLEVTVAGLGCNNFGWRIDAEATVPVVNAALEAGINFFDTADIYDNGHSEEYLGRALGARRKDVIIATKFGMKMDEGKQGARPEYVKQAAEDSLRRLGTDYIDLYQLHQPDPSVPIADTLGALDELVRAGKVRQIGASNFSADQLRAAAAAHEHGAGFVSVQNNYSMLYREPESAGVIAACAELGLTLIPYFPLANGLLTGKYRKGQPHPQGSRGQMGFGPKVFTEENLDMVYRLTTFAESKGHTILELAFSWLLAQKVVASVIAGATKAEQVKVNASAAGWKLSEEELRKVDGILGRKAPAV